MELYAMKVARTVLRRGTIRKNLPIPTDPMQLYYNRALCLSIIWPRYEVADIA